MTTENLRSINGTAVPPVGLGCMNLSHAYGHPPPPEVGKAVLHKALDLGVMHFDCAALYGFGRNEKLLGEVLPAFRDQIFLASKCGMTGIDGKRVIDGRPETLKKTCEDSLRRLQTEVIDLYYLHRWDKQVPLEDSIGALVELKEAGKIRSLGLSEVSAPTLRRVHGMHPVAAVQSEFSLWSRNAQMGVLSACEALDIAYVAFAPVARGFLADLELDPAELVAGDLRRSMPRFNAPHFEKNALLRGRFAVIAREAGCTPAQLALAWLLQVSPQTHPIPGTTNEAHLAENMAAINVVLEDNTVAALEDLINPNTVSGPRYNEATLCEVDTEKVSDAVG